MKKTLVRADDDRAREIAVMEDHSGRDGSGGQAKRQDNAKRLSRTKHVGKRVARHRRGARPVSAATLVLQFRSGVRSALTNAPGDAADLDGRDPDLCTVIGSAGRFRRVSRQFDVDGRGAPIVEAAPLARGVEAARQHQGEAHYGRRIEGHIQSQDEAKSARGLPPASYGGNRNAGRTAENEEYGQQEEKVEERHCKYFTFKSAMGQ